MMFSGHAAMVRVRIGGGGVLAQYTLDGSLI
jgi:hypothetical protein